MPNISCTLTTEPVRQHTKWVTRRLGWKRLKPGARLTIVEKGMGLKKGEHPVQLAKVIVVTVRRERLSALYREPYGSSEAVLEGFSEMNGRAFVAMFCREMRVHPNKQVTRIEWEYLD